MAAIYRECRSEATWLPTPVKDSDFARDTEGEVLLVAVDSNGEPQGFVSVWEADAFIHHLYVRAGSRQSGIGKQLLESLRPRLRRPWRLKCVRANDQALAFYLRLGWLEISSGVGEDGPYAVLEMAEATPMRFKSKAQRRKFAELLVEGKIKPEAYERWNVDTGRAKLPERVKPKTARKVKSKKRAAKRKKAGH